MSILHHYSKALLFKVIGGLGPDASRGCPAEQALLPAAGIRERLGVSTVYRAGQLLGQRGPTADSLWISSTP